MYHSLILDVRIGASGELDSASRVQTDVFNDKHRIHAASQFLVFGEQRSDSATFISVLTP
jgi:hypothetical protein